MYNVFFKDFNSIASTFKLMFWAQIIREINSKKIHKFVNGFYLAYVHLWFPPSRVGVSVLVVVYFQA